MGRLSTRWTDYLVKIGGSLWRQVAMDRSRSKYIGEAYDDDDDTVVSNEPRDQHDHRSSCKASTAGYKYLLLVEPTRLRPHGI